MSAGSRIGWTTAAVVATAAAAFAAGRRSVAQRPAGVAVAYQYRTVSLVELARAADPSVPVPATGLRWYSGERAAAEVERDARDRDRFSTALSAGFDRFGRAGWEPCSPPAGSALAADPSRSWFRRLAVAGPAVASGD